MSAKFHANPNSAVNRCRCAMLSASLLSAAFLQDTGAQSTTEAVEFDPGMNANGTPYAGQVTRTFVHPGSPRNSRESESYRS